MDEEMRLKEIILDLQNCLKQKEMEIKNLQKKVTETKRVDVEPMGQNEFDKLVKCRMPMLSENQIALMTKRKKRVSWTTEELSKGFTSAFFSQRCHRFWIHDLGIPLPSVRTLNRYAARMVIAPGILKDVLFMLKGFAAQLSEAERQVVLSFDEMACKALVKYHKGLDQVFGPNKEMQVVMVRGLMSRFKQPIYINFDTAMTKLILYEAISSLHEVGLNVVSMVSDCGGSNVGLWKEVNVSCSRNDISHFFKHPITGKNIYVFADAPHMLKLIRNWFLDYGFVLKDGTIIKKDKVYELLQLVNSEISPAFKLSELHFDCKDTERMNVALAAELLSHTTATCLRRYFPDDADASKLADFIDMVNYWFDVMNSYTSKGPWYKRAYGLELKHQDKVLDEMYSTIQSMKCYDSKKDLRESLQTFQKGILFSIKSLKALFNDLNKEMGFTYILTHRLNQDCLENFFSQVRGKNRFKEHPNTVECLYNIRAIILGRNPSVCKQLHTNTVDKLPDEYVTSEFCKRASNATKHTSLDDSFVDDNDAFDEIDPFLECNEEDIDHFEECSSMSSYDGTEYIAGWIQKKLKYGNPILSRASKPVNQDAAKISFVSAVSQGGLTKPDDLVLNMVHNMENEFFKIHGKGFTRQPNIRLNLISQINRIYTEIPHDIVNLFARSRIYFRCNYLNKVAQDKAIKERIERRKAKAKAIEEAKVKAIEEAKTKPIVEDNVTKEVPSKKAPLTAYNRTNRKRAAMVPVNDTAYTSDDIKKKKPGKGKHCRASLKSTSNIHVQCEDIENVGYCDGVGQKKKTGNVNYSRTSHKRSANVPVHVLHIETVDCADDIERKRTRKVKKFLT